MYTVGRTGKADDAIEVWRSDAVPPEAVAFAKQVVRETALRDANRANALLYAASRLGAFAWYNAGIGRRRRLHDPLGGRPL